MNDTPDQTSNVPPIEAIINQPDEDKDIFAEHSSALFDNFGAQCDAMNIKYALVIIVNPITGQPAVFSRGESYTLAKLTKIILLKLREDVLDELST